MPSRTTVIADTPIAYERWRRENPDLTAICQYWKLSSATSRLPYLFRPGGEAAFWSVDLIHHLADLSKITRDGHEMIKGELTQVGRLRLARFPESGQDMIPQDVETVLKRHQFISSKRAQKMAKSAFDKAIPRLDQFPTPPSFRKRRRTAYVGDNDGAEGRPSTRSRTSTVHDATRRGSRKARPVSPTSQRDLSPIAPVRMHSPPPPPEKDTPLPAPTSNPGVQVSTANTSSDTLASHTETHPFQPIPETLTNPLKLVVLRGLEVAQISDLGYWTAVGEQKMRERNITKTRYDILILEVVMGLRAELGRSREWELLL
ncbi:hypothetical protein CC86DRAFT_407541 [Ophiobolus disseminans]|uniref:Uncharacterized protein n=1 Tax=Ophiobolus disseminans TaxID=1469910 RepID=A0A6A6ZWT3_9PLEO|nr:hypothetical protein CC86DRAFT_407541 [Ophiobolus disseminans]